MGIFFTCFSKEDHTLWKTTRILNKRRFAEVHHRFYWVCFIFQKKIVCSGLGVIKQEQFGDLVCWTKSSRWKEWNTAKPLIGKISAGTHGNRAKTLLVHSVVCTVLLFLSMLGHDDEEIAFCLTQVLSQSGLVWYWYSVKLWMFSRWNPRARLTVLRRPLTDSCLSWLIFSYFVFSPLKLDCWLITVFLYTVHVTMRYGPLLSLSSVQLSLSLFLISV